jgi:hypothetical protein
MEVKVIKFWRLLSVSIVLAVCLGLMLVPAALATEVTSAQTGNVGIEVVPDVTKVGYNEDFSVDIRIIDTAAQDIAAWTVYLEFNTTLMHVTGIDPCTTLPTGYAPDDIPGYPKWDNTTGVLEHQSGTLFEDPYVNTSFDVMTVHFRSNNVPGIGSVNFANISPLYRTWVEDGSALPVLNWTMVVDGTVKVGETPAISVSPNSLAFNAIEGGENPSTQTLEICNWGSGTLDWSLTDNAGWLSETPQSSSLGEGDCEDVTVAVDVAGMEAGDYSATITITGSGEVRVPVSLHIESAGVPVPVGPANLSASSLSISPQQVEPDEQVTVSIKVANTGGETGSYNAILYINDVVEDNQTVSVTGGTSKNVIFTVSKSEAGVYDISLAGQSGQFEVVGGGRVGGGGLGTGGIIVIVVAVIALIVGLFLIRRGTRRGT